MKKLFEKLTGKKADVVIVDEATTVSASDWRVTEYDRVKAMIASDKFKFGSYEHARDAALGYQSGRQVGKSAVHDAFKAAIKHESSGPSVSSEAGSAQNSITSEQFKANIEKMIKTLDPKSIAGASGSLSARKAPALKTPDLSGLGPIVSGPIVSGTINAAHIAASSITANSITNVSSREVDTLTKAIRAMNETIGGTSTAMGDFKRALEQAGVASEVVSDAFKKFHITEKEAEVAKQKMTDQEKFRITTAMEDIIAAIKDEVFAVDHTPTVTMKLPDGQFRNKPIFRGWEFFLSNAYMGARDNLILCFTPVDAQEFESIELGPQSADEVFPLLGTAIAKAMCVEGETLDGVIDAVRVTAAAQEMKEAEEAKAQAEASPIWGMF